MNSKRLLSVALGVLFILLLISSVYANELYHQISIDVKNSEGVRNILSLGIDPSGMQYDPEKGTLDIALSESELREVESLGYNYIITIPDLVSYYASRSDGLDMGGYRTYSEVVTDLNTLVSSYPGYTRLIDIGHTHRDSVIWALKISDNPYMDENEPEVLYTGLTHAREPIGMECCMDFAEWLLSNYGSDPTATDLVDNREIWIIPIINVDGYIYNQEQSPNGGGMWRKNRRDNGGSYGVDPNRNYSYMWGYDDQGSSPYPSDDTYRGPSAGSEPCNQAVMQFSESHEFITALHYHAHGEYLIYPWGYDQLETPDHDLFVEIADSAVSMNGYAPGRAWELLYAVNGDACDWSYGELGILSFTPEVGNSSDGFWPDPSRIQPLIDLNRPVNIYIAEVAGTLVKFNFPDGLPSLINPLGGTTVRVEISGGQDGTGILYYNDGSGWEQNSMTLVSSGVYDAVFPATDCGSTVDYYFSVLDLESGTHYNPAGAPAATYNVLSANGFISIFEDNFETNQGWTAENLGASSGDWQRGVPVNDPGWEYDPAADGDGSGQCYLTQNQTGNTDVDGGAVRLTSPSFDMSTGGKISYEYYLYLTDTSGGVDRLLVEMNDNGGAGTWYEVTRHDTNGSTSWRHSDITEDDITSAGLSLTANMMIRFTANDADPASIVEAGIDGFSVIVADCYLPDVTIEMIPDDDPVYTTQGGSFDFTGKLYNHTAQQQYTDVWIMLVLPNSNWFGPIRQWNNIPLAPNDSLVDSNASQYIPWYALVGDYEYWAFCGDYPSATMDSAMFEFLIFPGLNNGQNNWDLYSSFGGSDVVIPSETVLHDNYPNPFNATTQIKFDLSKACDVNLRVYNISGQLVETLLDGEMQSGHHIVEWNASTVSSGIYFYKLQAGEIITTKKMNLLK